MSNEQGSWPIFPLLPGINGELHVSDTPRKNLTIPLWQVKTVLNREQLARCEGKPVQQRMAYLRLRYGKAHLINHETAKSVLVPRLSSRRPGRLHHSVIGSIHREETIPYWVEPTTRIDGDRVSLREDLPIPAMIACVQLASTSQAKNGHIAIEESRRFLHWQAGGWSLVYTRRPSEDAPGVIILLSRHLVMNVIASYALALIGPHRA